ncbi:3385_t:CDS:1, partial [Dentiscutata heterogama]
NSNIISKTQPSNLINNQHQDINSKEQQIRTLFPKTNQNNNNINNQPPTTNNDQNQN